ncbi:MAG TPA: AAA family ATPase, partial [Rikenellaceae bacterium]|nr:AAA family ATPase [Rikenellaceae bacterium]
MIDMELSDMKVLREFDNYLHFGVYPFYKEAGDDFLAMLQNVVKLVVESDLP